MATRSLAQAGQLLVGLGIVLLLVALAAIAPGVRAPAAGQAPATSPHPRGVVAGQPAPYTATWPMPMPAPALAPAPVPALGGQQ